MIKAPLRTVVEGARLGEVTQVMRRRRVRRLPVVDTAGNLVGIVSLDDVFRFLARELVAGFAPT